MYDELHSRNDRTDAELFGNAPKVRKGTWILDATMASPDPNPLGSLPEPHGFFYRVTAVTAESAGTITVEIQQPVQQVKDLNGNNIIDTSLPHGSGGNVYGIAVVMENVVEVFDRKTLTSVITPVP